MKEKIGVRFRPNGKIYDFDPKEKNVTTGTHVIVQTKRGMELGTVVRGPEEESDEKRAEDLIPIVRIATPEDLRKKEENKIRAKEAFKIGKEKIRESGLNMKLVDTEYTFDGSKVIFYFTAENRVDFRDLVRTLASALHMKIELRQIGSRDEAKMKGGIGICGRELCCHTFLNTFSPVSIKMAKEQGLSLNAGKISGICGRLLCCLNNEEETYEYLNAKLPRVGDLVTTEDGTEGIVSYVNVLRQTVRFVVTDEDENKEVREESSEKLTFRSRKRRTACPAAAAAEKQEREKRKNPKKGSRPGSDNIRGTKREESHDRQKTEEKPHGRSRNFNRSQRPHRGKPENAAHNNRGTDSARKDHE